MCKSRESEERQENQVLHILSCGLVQEYFEQGRNILSMILFPIELLIVHLFLTGPHFQVPSSSESLMYRTVHVS
jgi:hypothetical protein